MSNLENTITKWRQFAVVNRHRKSATRDAGLDEYLWQRESDTIDRVLDDIEASLHE